MTQNQLQYWRNVETERSNRAQEAIGQWRAAIEQGALDHRIDSFFKQLDFDKSKWSEQLDLEWFRAQWDAFSKYSRGIKDLTGAAIGLAGWVVPKIGQGTIPKGPTQFPPGTAPAVVPELVPNPVITGDEKEPESQPQESKKTGWGYNPIPAPAGAITSIGNNSAGSWAPSATAAGLGLAALGFVAALGGRGGGNPLMQHSYVGDPFDDLR